MHAVYREARATLLLAVPIIIGQVGQMAMGVTDSVMIGRAGTVPLAASSFGVGIFNIFFIIGIGLLTPVAVFASRARGAGRHDEAGEFLRHGLLLGLGSGVVEVGVILFLGFHLERFRQQPEVLAAVNPFFLLLGLSLVPVARLPRPAPVRGVDGQALASDGGDPRRRSAQHPPQLDRSSTGTSARRGLG